MEQIERDGLGGLFVDLIKEAMLVKVLKENESKYEVLVIPWGGLHLPGIEKEIIKTISQKVTIE